MSIRTWREKRRLKHEIRNTLHEMMRLDLSCGSMGCASYAARQKRLESRVDELRGKLAELDGE